MTKKKRNRTKRRKPRPRGSSMMHRTGIAYIDALATQRQYCPPAEVWGEAPSDAYDEESRRQAEEAAARDREMLDLIKSEYLDLIPAMEADIIEMIYIHEKRQEDIAQIFGVTQTAVGYRLFRAFDRLRYLHERPKLTPAEIEIRVLKYAELSENNKERECVVASAPLIAFLWINTSQHQASVHFKKSVGTTRHRIMSTLRVLEKYAPEDELTIWLRKMNTSVPAHFGWNILQEVDTWASKRKAMQQISQDPGELEALEWAHRVFGPAVGS